MSSHVSKWRAIFGMFMVLAMAAGVPQSAVAQGSDGKLPNILVIMGDDVGWFNLSAYNHGIMGYKTPNLDRIAREGVMFTDAYAEQSCTAGRAAFITGQHGLRTGMTKVGLPGVPFGLDHEDPTIAEMLKPYGYATGQFGKNHLGDTDDTLPTTHGFDEFFGNLYHLNAEQEPEHPDYPEDPEFYEKFGPRGVIHSYAAGHAPTNIPKPLKKTAKKGTTGYWHEETGQYIIDTGPLTIQRMKTIDGATTRESIRFMAESVNDDEPFFVWWNSTRMHVWTHLKEEEGYQPGKEVPLVDRKCYDPGVYTQEKLCNLGQAEDYYAEGKTGLGIYPDGMVEHDMYVGQLLNFLDEKNIADNTIVIYTTDNGAETFTWPDGGTTPFRSEKATNWEGGYRVPLLIRWPRLIEGGSVSNTFISLLDFAPTLVAAVSEASGKRVDIAKRLKVEYDLGSTDPNAKTYKVHLDGYDFLDYFRCAFRKTKDARECVSPRNEFIYANDDGVLTAIRYGDYKAVFYEQRAEGGLAVWEEPFTQLRMAKLIHLRSDPFEKADHEASDYDFWRFDRAFALTPIQVATYEFLQTFQLFPPRQAPPSFSIDIDIKEIIEKCGTVDERPDDLSDCFAFGNRLHLPGGGG